MATGLTPTTAEGARGGGGAARCPRPECAAQMPMPANAVAPQLQTRHGAGAVGSRVRE